MAQPSRTQPFDLDLFVKLNEEYRSHPLVAEPRGTDAASLLDEARRRARSVDLELGIRGKRVLGIGCAEGLLPRVLAEDYGCQVVAVESRAAATSPSHERPGVTFVQRDLTEGGYDDLGRFDVVVGFEFEQLPHPYATLAAITHLLAPEGRAYIAAGLYRGPRGSNRYREVFFPWPQLLFADDVFAEFYRTHHGREDTAAWANKLTHLHYASQVERAGLRPVRTWLTPSPVTFDEEFYQRFHDQLSRYPRFDLSHDFYYAIVERGAPRPTTADFASSRRIAELEREVKLIRRSASWRVTAPLRRAGTLARKVRRR